eukprot:ANDGO_04390.mRNA.1 hypothetical protein ACA1_072570
MILESVWLSAFFSGILAAAIAVLVTRVIEKLGGALGGILATTPTTIIPSALGLYFQSSQAGFELSMFSVAPTLLLNAFFLYLWKIIPPKLNTSWELKRKLAVMVCISLGSWFILATGLVLVLSLLSSTSAMFAIAIVAASAQFITGGAITFRLNTTPKGKNRVPWTSLGARALLAGMAVGSAVLISTTSPLAAGITSCFPAIFLTSMVGLWLSQGEAVPLGAVGPMIIGSSSVSVFAVLAVFLFQVVGPWIGLIISYMLVVGFVSAPVYYYLRWRQRVNSRDSTSDSVKEAELSDTIGFSKLVETEGGEEADVAAIENK